MKWWQAADFDLLVKKAFKKCAFCNLADAQVSVLYWRDEGLERQHVESADAALMWSQNWMSSGPLLSDERRRDDGMRRWCLYNPLHITSWGKHTLLKAIKENYDDRTAETWPETYLFLPAHQLIYCIITGAELWYSFCLLQFNPVWFSLLYSTSVLQNQRKKRKWSKQAALFSSFKAQNILWSSWFCFFYLLKLHGRNKIICNCWNLWRVYGGVNECKL